MKCAVWVHLRCYLTCSRATADTYGTNSFVFEVMSWLWHWKYTEDLVKFYLYLHKVVENINYFWISFIIYIYLRCLNCKEINGIAGIQFSISAGTTINSCTNMEAVKLCYTPCDRAENLNYWMSDTISTFWISLMHKTFFWCNILNL